MQFIKSSLVLGLAAVVLADNDCDVSNGVTMCSSGVSGAATASSSYDGGILVPVSSTTLDIQRSTGLVPLYTQTVYTSTETDVNGATRTLTYTSSVYSSPTETLYSRSTDLGLQGGYALTTLSNGVVTETYTGSGSAPPLTKTPTQLASSASVAAKSGSTSSGGAAIATGMPYLGAAAAVAGGLAYLI